MRIIYSNLFDNYTLVESQEDENYPVENVQDIRLATVWRTETASASSIVIDAGTGATITCDCCAVLAHNFSTAATITIQANTADTWVTPGLSSAVTYREDIMVLFFTSSPFRYWRFYFDETGNADGYYEIGRLFLGTYLQIDPSSAVEFPEKHLRSDRISFSISGQPYSDQGLEHIELDYKFGRSSDSMKSKIETMYGSVGLWKPILFTNYDTTYSVIPPIYVSIVKEIVFEHLEFDYWKYSLSLREAQ